MEPVKKQNNIAAGFAAIGVALVAAIGVFASTFNPPAQSAVTPDISSTDVTPIKNPPTTTAPNPIAFGSIFPAPETTSKTSSQPVTKSVTTVVSSVYRNGTYSATGSYNSPGGQDQVAVTLSLRNDIVTSVTTTPSAQDRTSARYQAMFMSGYKQYVIGRDISSIHLDQVSGSSLTGIGFNAALAKIEAEAKA